MQNKTRFTILISLLLIVTLVMGGCSSSTPAPSTSAPAPSTQPPAVATTTSAPPPVTSTSPSAGSTTSQTVYELKFTHQFPPGSSQEQVIQLLGKAISDKTGGRVTFKLFGSESLGKATDFINMLNGGVADAALLSAGTYPAQFDMELGPELPGLGIQSRQERVDLTWDLLNKGYLTGLSAFKPLAMYAGPSLTMFLKKQAQTVADLKGLKIRTSTAPVTAFIQNFGGTPVAMTFADQYSSLERGVIDGTITAYESFIPAKTYEVCKYALLNPLGSPCLFIVMSKTAWDKIPADLQAKVNDGIQAFRPQFVDFVKGPDATWADTLKQNGVTVYSFNADESTKLKAAADPIKATWIADHQAKGLPAKDMMDYIDSYIAQYK